ncbi:MAG: pyridine nucleotide-disulfide oxidoreductase [Firmicutes bacterium ML8_F2]|jgi:NADH oxidase (H2O2-forming)|nr:MAG: pyridine nucleotide-disulfide oxidoreductase [Firmicutes bacterium ML8_F2]
MNKTDILIIGGGPAGIVAAVTTRKNYPDKKVSLVRKEEKEVIPCGIPYIFDRLNSVEDNIMSSQSLIDNQVDLITGEAIKLDSEKKTVILKDKNVYQYDKLVLALGSESHLVPIPGLDKSGVWQVKKDHEYLEKLREAAKNAKNIAIIGGGFIGVELAEELSSLKNLKVSIFEMMEHCLLTNFDEEFAKAAEERLKDKSIDIYAGVKIKEVSGQDKVEYLELADGKKIPADLVILSIGARPNIKLAQEAGIKVEEKGGIWVDEYMKTSQPDILAIGDCAQTRDFITGKNIPVMLASVAASEARIAASNLYHIKLIRENKGTLGVFSTYLNGLTLAAAGLTETRAKEEKFEYVIGEAKALNRHPGKLPGAELIGVKLIFSKSSEGLLLGGEIMGPVSVGEMINAVAMAIQHQATLYDFNTWQIASHPLLTSAPTVYPLIAAAQDALLKLEK